MAAENDVKKLGRIEYIEPNSLFITSEGNKVQNGIPQPYEDYSFSVNLRVINGDRYSCGMTDDGGDIANNFVEFSSDNGTISFMDGTTAGGESYLTTNFTDISMNNPETNTKECLGIESISIKYDSWFYPTVDIKFIDVRGASLMQPAEYEYYNNGNPNPVQGKNRASTNSDFFKAFFSFPYPLFKLSVKGFYGKEVTYDLSVLKCNVTFNSSIGCFEINASFIGYMYGMYGDLPFPFVYLAPYINLYGKNTWDEKKNTGDFCYVSEKTTTAKTMYTFPELRTAVQNAGEKAKKELEVSPDGKRRIELEKLSKELAQTVLFRYPMSSKNSNWWSWAKVNTGKERSGYFYLPIENSNENNRKIFDDFLTFSTNLQEYNKFVGTTENYKDEKVTSKEIFDDFLSDIENIRKRKNTTETGSSIYTDEEVRSVLGRHMVVLAFHKEEKTKDKQVLVFDSDKSSFGKNSKSDFNDLITELIRKFDSDDAMAPMHKKSAQKEWTIRAFQFSNLNFKNGIVDKLNRLNKELDELTRKLDKEREQKIVESVEFDPTIKNLYNMVFAHIDTFMSCFYNTLDRIRQSIQSSTDDSRKYKKLCGDSITTDVNENSLKSESSNGGKLPPFTMFYKEETVKDSEDKKVVMVWPGELNGGDKLDEVKLVEAIINATSLERRSTESVTPKDNVIEREGDLAPTNYYDIIRDGGNPYLDVLNEKNLQDEKSAKLVLDIFLYRCFYAMMNGSYTSPISDGDENGSSTSTANFTKKAKLIADIEVGNIERAFQMLNMKPTKAFLQGLNKLPNEGALLLRNYVSGEKPILKSRGISGDLVYNGIPRYDKDGNLLCNYLPVGIFAPSVLENYSKDAKLGKNVDKFLVISPYRTIMNNSFTCRLYSGGKRLEATLNKYTSGDFSSAARLFPNYGKLPKDISGVTFEDGTFKSAKSAEENRKVSFNNLYSGRIDGYISLPSSRKTSAGVTNIFMDPLYYAQTCPEARAYLFLMGIPFGEDKKYFLPDMAENGDYPTLMLLREGAYYWRNEGIITIGEDDAPIAEFENDPITYEYTINGVTNNVLNDIEKNDPCFGREVALEFYKNPPKNASRGRKQILMDYFLKWADGISPEKNPHVVIPTVTATSYVHIDIPSPVVSFPKIEQMFGLWETSGNTKQLLSPESCASAVTAEFAGTFANSTSLNIFYNVDKDGRLGKTNDKKIRTNVFMREKPGGEDSAPAEYLKFYRSFVKFYTGFDTIIDFSCPDIQNIDLTVPGNAISVALSAFVSGLKDANKISIDKIKEGTFVDSSGQPEDKGQKDEYYRSRDLKLACYIALKSMYDRWLCNRRRECWSFSCIPEKMSTKPIKSDFLKFFYVDEFYHDTSMKVRPNLTNFIENICGMGAFTEKSDAENLASCSIIKILSKTAQFGNCSLLTLPTMLGLAKTYTEGQNSIGDVFKAFTYNEAVKSDAIETSFIVLSTSQKSAVLNVPDDKGKMGYKSDGFDIANSWGEIVPQPMFSDAAGDGFIVPSFGVTFAKQNQSFFKDIRLSMDDHQVTDFSIRNELMISYQSNRGPRETTMVGQDLYSVYSNYSYSCTVTMMGDAQITPLMYFQLNNIPMWKGAYLITSVRHDITTHGMETVFTGVRQARPATPFKDDSMEVPANSAAKQTAYSQEETHIGTGNEENFDSSAGELYKIDIEQVTAVTFILNRESITTDANWINGSLTILVNYDDGTLEYVQNIAQTLEPTFGDIEHMGTPDGKIENFTPGDSSYHLPSGRFSIVSIEDPLPGKEYRGRNDTFYKFTEGKHMLVTETKLEPRYSELIIGALSPERFMDTGSTDFYNFDSISLGGISPIMMYPPANPEDSFKQFDMLEKMNIYKEVFNFIRKVKEAKKPVNFLITEKPDIKSCQIDLFL